MTVTMVYDLETIPDVNLGRKLLDMPEATDQAVVDALIERRRNQTQGSEFLPHYLHQVVAISVVVRTPQWIKVWSLGEKDSSEKEIIERFFAGLEKYSPTLVSWNGSGFDLPVLHYRSLMHGIQAAKYWDLGERDPGFKWNNYLNRYHLRHTDLMDVLASYQSRACAPLNEISTMLGLPGKMGMHGSLVFEEYQRNNIEIIRNYCETDVLNTYLVYLQFEFVRGLINSTELEQKKIELQDSLKALNKEHLDAFLNAWEF